MIEPNFVVETTLDAKVQLEASRALMPKASKIMAYALAGILLVLVIVLAVTYVQTGDSSNLVQIVIALAALGIFSYLQIFGTKISMRRWEKQMLAQYGTASLNLVTEFYDNTLTQVTKQNNAELEYGYSKLTAFRETENTFLLQLSKYQWFFIDKKGFTKGDADSFRSFIQGRIGV